MSSDDENGKKEFGIELRRIRLQSDVKVVLAEKRYMKDGREKKQVSQVDLAGLLEVHLHSVENWEAGRTTPTLAMVRKIATVLHLKDQDKERLIAAYLNKAEHDLRKVPYSRNRSFIGRDEVLQSLEKALAPSQHKTQDQQASPSQPVVLYGLPGMGKTDVAIEYAHRHGMLYQAVFWIQASTSQDIVNSLTELAPSLLGISNKELLDANALLSAITDWLRAHTDWLLIFDNVDINRLDEQLYQFIKTCAGLVPQGHVLMTTRAYPERLSFRTYGIKLDKMEQKDGITLLLRRAGYIHSDQDADDYFNSITGSIRYKGVDTTAKGVYKEAAIGLWRALSGLPLALEQAGAYMAQTGCDLVLYFERYQKEHLRARRGPSPPQSVWTTFSLLYKEVEKSSSAALALLHLCAFLAPSNISEEIVVRGAPDLGPELRAVALPNSVEMDTTVQVLLQYSLVRRFSRIVPAIGPREAVIVQTLEMHELVQTVLREQMDTDMQCLWAKRAILAVNHSLPDVTYQSWAECQRFVPHAEICISLIQQWKFGFPEAARLLTQLGHFTKMENLLGSHTQKEVIALYRRALAIRQQVLPLGHLAIAESCDDLAEVYHDQKQYAEAGGRYWQALMIREMSREPRPLDVAKSRENLGCLYRNQEKYTAALESYTQALTLRIEALGPEHPHVADTYEEIAEVYLKQKDYEQARQSYQQALAIYERLPPDQYSGRATVVCDKLKEIQRLLGEPTEPQEGTQEMVQEPHQEGASTSASQQPSATTSQGSASTPPRRKLMRLRDLLKFALMLVVVLVLVLGCILGAINTSYQEQLANRQATASALADDATWTAQSKTAAVEQATTQVRWATVEAQQKATAGAQEATAVVQETATATANQQQLDQIVAKWQTLFAASLGRASEQEQNLPLTPEQVANVEHVHAAVKQIEPERDAAYREAKAQGVLSPWESPALPPLSQRQLKLDDPLHNPPPNLTPQERMRVHPWTWDEGDFSKNSDDGACLFLPNSSGTSHQYHVSIDNRGRPLATAPIATPPSGNTRTQRQTDEGVCLARSTSFSDFMYQVQMTILQGDGGGMLFRVHTDKTGEEDNLRYFYVSRSGKYALYSHDSPSHLASGQDMQNIQTGSVGQVTNMLTVITVGPVIELYVNYHCVAVVYDPLSSSSAHSGLVGLAAGSVETTDYVDVAFGDAKVWKLTDI